MNKYYSIITPTLILSYVFFAADLVVSQTPLEAENVKKEESKEDKVIKKLPKSGMLASTNNGGLANTAGGFGDTALDDEEGNNPIGGSVSKAGNTWVAKVFNNSKRQVTGSFRVLQLDKNEKGVKSDSFSASLSPNQSVERVFPSNPLSVSGSLEIASWKSKKIEAPKEENVPIKAEAK